MLNKALKIVKLFLIDPRLQSILIGMLVLIYPIYEFTKIILPTRTIKISDLRSLYNFEAFLKVNSYNGFYSFLESTLLPSIYKDYPTPFVVFTPPEIYQIGNENDQKIDCILDSSAAVLSDCSTGTLSSTDQAIVDIAFQQSSKQSCAVTGYINSYSNCQYRVELSRINYTDIILSLKKHGWLNNKSKFVMVQFSGYNVLEGSYFFLKYLLEIQRSDGGGLISSIKHGIVNNPSRELTITALIFIIGLNLIYTMKMFLEFNLTINKWTLIGHIANIVASWCYVGFALARQLMSNSIDSISSLDEIYSAIKSQALSVLFIFFFLPFRVFAWMSQFKYFRWLKKIGNSIFKTLPGMFTVALTFYIAYLLAVQLPESKIYEELTLLQSDPQTQFLSSFGISSFEISKFGFNSSFYFPFYHLSSVLIRLANIIFIIYSTSFFIDLFKRTTDIEFREQSKYQIEFKELLGDLDEKVESTKSVITEYIQKEEMDKNKEQKQKIMLYYHLKSMEESEGERFELIHQEISEKQYETLQDISSTCSEHQVTIRKFEDLEQMTQFIICLTNIRSEYFSQNSGEKFRIFFYLENLDFFQESKVNQLNSFLDVLSKNACQYPIMYFSNSFTFPHEVQVALRSIYRLSLCTESSDVQKQFCSMLIPFKQLEYSVYSDEARPKSPITTQLEEILPRIAPTSTRAQEQAFLLPPLKTTQKQPASGGVIVGSIQNPLSQEIAGPGINPQNTINTYKSFNSSESKDLSTIS